MAQKRGRKGVSRSVRQCPDSGRAFAWSLQRAVGPVPIRSCLENAGKFSCQLSQFPVQWREGLRSVSLLFTDLHNGIKFCWRCLGLIHRCRAFPPPHGASFRGGYPRRSRLRFQLTEITAFRKPGSVIVVANWLGMSKRFSR